MQARSEKTGAPGAAPDDGAPRCGWRAKTAATAVAEWVNCSKKKERE